MSRKTLRRSHLRLVPESFEQPLDRSEFREISDGRGSSMRINVFDGFVPGMFLGIGHGEFHTSLSSDSRRSDHIVPVRIGPVPHEFGVNLGSSGLGVFQLLEDDDPPSSGDAEPITVLVEGPTRLLGRVVVRGAQRPHAVEHAGEVPIDALSGSAEGDVGLIQENLLVPRPDAVRSGAAGRGDGETHSLDLERRGEHGAGGRSHGSGDPKGSHLVLPPSSSLDRLDGLDDVGDGRSSLSEDGAHSRIFLVFLRFHPRILDGPSHGDVGVLGVGPHEANVGLGDEFLEVFVGEVGFSADVGFDAQVGPFLVELESGLGFVEGVFDLFEGVPEAGCDAHAGDYDSAIGHGESRGSEGFGLGPSRCKRRNERGSGGADCEYQDGWELHDCVRLEVRWNYYNCCCRFFC
mmetsp:Transcript_30160/g.61554  ORF Transcript_30160/g.61554 Transcript_30160/m.61554 type:complete len:405 (-) Transcript_30160:168-1382(-)